MFIKLITHQSGPDSVWIFFLQKTHPRPQPLTTNESSSVNDNDTKFTNANAIHDASMI